VDTGDFTVVPPAAAGDPFVAAAEHSERHKAAPCCCNGGLVTISYEEDGQTYFVLLYCKRCGEGEHE
jgi:hypothetical protein